MFTWPMVEPLDGLGGKVNAIFLSLTFSHISSSSSGSTICIVGSFTVGAGSAAGVDAIAVEALTFPLGSARATASAWITGGLVSSTTSTGTGAQGPSSSSPRFSYSSRFLLSFLSLEFFLATEILCQLKSENCVQNTSNWLGCVSISLNVCLVIT